MRRSRKLLDRGLLVLALTALPFPALAWKPYTHNTSAAQAYIDALDGKITIDGREYPIIEVEPGVDLGDVLRDNGAHYNAGVIGPDGFPDLVYGQSQIHPNQTGVWLRLLLARAQALPCNPSDTSPLGSLQCAEKRKALAFTYGFLTHAAGDLWGHTFINDFARGVFPSLTEILTSTEHREVAIRHIAAEGYVGDATPGFDGNRDDWTAAPRPPYVGDLCPEGDARCTRSDDETLGFAYDAPHGFINSTLVTGSIPTGAGRGDIIDHYLDLRAGLDALLHLPFSVPLDSALAAYNDTLASLSAVEQSCNFESWDDAAHDAFFACAEALLEFGWDVVIDSLEAFVAFASGVLEQAAMLVFVAYVEAWIEDIDQGLANWSHLGLAITQALFDPATRRALQDEECHSWAGQNDPSLAPGFQECEKGQGMVDVLFDSLDPFLRNQQEPSLVSMLGAPDLLLDASAALNEILDFIDQVMYGLFGDVINPVRASLATLEEYVKESIKEQLSEVLGIDLEALGDLLSHPSRWVCLDSKVVNFPPPLGTVTINLFQTGDHERLDGFLHLPPGHHIPPQDQPADCGRLADTAELSFGGVAALRNTVTTAKLLLLDGPVLNTVLSDLLGGRTITTYAPGENIMVKELAGPGLEQSPWLRSIDGDHAWRQDGLPRFCDQGGHCPDGAKARAAELNGGHGNFPIWESCVLRPAFRRLFVDWEGEGDGFPDLEDDASADPDNDPNPPASVLPDPEPHYKNGDGRIYVAAGHEFTQSAHDGPAGRAFQDDELSLQRRVYFEGTAPGPFAEAGQNTAFTLAGEDGVYVVEYQSADPCHDFDGQPAAAEPVQVRRFTLDTKPPVVTCQTPPFGREWDTDDAPAVTYGVDDGRDGSGVQSESSKVDGYQGLPGVVPTLNGGTLDLFFFYPGTRQVVVSAKDNLGNAGTTACSFELHATPESLIANVDRAQAMGLIASVGIANSLRQKLEEVKRLHERGQHASEHNVLEAIVKELLTQRGKKVDAATADRFVAYALDRISLGR